MKPKVYVFWDVVAQGCQRLTEGFANLGEFKGKVAGHGRIGKHRIVWIVLSLRYCFHFFSGRHPRHARDPLGLFVVTHVTLWASSLSA
jgi:hypothetical protein